MRARVRLDRALLPCLLSVLILAVPLASQAAASDAVLRILSYREPERIDVIIRVFEGSFNAKVKLVHERRPSIETLREQQETAPFDLLISNDAILLEKAARAGLTLPIADPTVLAQSAAPFRSTDGHWVGTSIRARAIFTASDRVATPPQSYEELALPQWKGRICIRSAAHAYNVALVAAMIERLGAANAEMWLRGVKANLARRPTGGDRDQLRALVAGSCDVALANTYYLTVPHTAQNSAEERTWSQKLTKTLPSSPKSATHVNAAGVAILKGVVNVKLAEAFVEFLASESTQQLMETLYGEYPVRPVSALTGTQSPLVHADRFPLARLAALESDARVLIKRVDFDAGP